MDCNQPSGRPDVNSTFFIGMGCPDGKCTVSVGTSQQPVTAHGQIPTLYYLYNLI